MIYEGISIQKGSRTHFSKNKREVEEGEEEVVIPVNQEAIDFESEDREDERIAL